MHSIQAFMAQLRRRKEERRRFFRDACEEIAEKNLALLRGVSFLAVLLLLFFFLITPLILPAWHVTAVYLLMVPAMGLFFLFAQLYLHCKTKSPRVITMACTLFYIVLMCFIIGIEVLPYPDQPESFMTIGLMLIPAVLILKTYIINTLLIGFEICFLIFVKLFKAESVQGHDIFTTIAALFFAFLISYIVSGLRADDNNAKIRYRHLSRTDLLAGILNKATCETYAETYLQVRYCKTSCALLIVDLDDFKAVNDKLGHQCGDALLEATGAALRRLFRSSDIVGRVGGDEFMILIKNIPNAAAVKKKAEQVRRAVADTVLKQAEITAGCSIGAAIAPANREVSFEELYLLADDALYEAKAFHKGSFVVHTTLETACSRKPEKPRILIVDDSEVSRALLASIFEEKFEILLAQNGAQALDFISQYRSTLAAVLLDIMMPGIDGYAVLRYLKSRPSFSDIPVLVITADETNEEQALLCGADDWIAKPIDPAIAHLRVANALRHKATTGSSVG